MIPTKQIRIEKWKQVKDSKGDSKESIEVAYNMWAEPMRVSGNRSSFNNLSNTVRFKIRFRPDWEISSVWKIIYLQQRYTITSIERINEKRFNWIINGEG